MDHKREISRGAGSSKNAESKEGERAAKLRPGAKRKPERMHVVGGSIGKRGERMAERLDDGAEMKAREFYQAMCHERRLWRN